MTTLPPCTDTTVDCYTVNGTRIEIHVADTMFINHLTHGATITEVTYPCTAEEALGNYTGHCMPLVLIDRPAPVYEQPLAATGSGIDFVLIAIAAIALSMGVSFVLARVIKNRDRNG